MRAILAACALILTANSALAQFEIDISSLEISRILGNPTLGDMAINERGYIHTFAVCIEEGRLFAMTHSRLIEPTESGGQLEVRRLPQNTVEISIYLGSLEFTAQDRREQVIRNIAEARVCDSARVSNTDFEVFRIKSIDGHGSLSELANSRR